MASWEWSADELPDLATKAAAGRVGARRCVTMLLAGQRPDRRALGAFVDELARLAAAGSAPATDLLVEAVDVFGLARSSVRKILVDDDEVADALQDVLVAVATTIGSFRAESQFTTWLHQVARNKAVACLRRRSEPASDLSDEMGGPVRVSSMVALRATLVDAVAGLPSHYRDAVVLRDLEGLPYTDVAQRLGLPLNTARTRIVRGRALLARNLVSR